MNEKACKAVIAKLMPEAYRAGADLSGLSPKECLERAYRAGLAQGQQLFDETLRAAEQAAEQEDG